MATDKQNLAEATFAGGCFWCMEPPFDALDGVISTTAGYAGGTEINPNYQQVAGGLTGHAEVIRIVFDPEKVSYEQLLDVFWRNIDPTAVGRQFVDVGRQYRSAIFYHNVQQQILAEQSRDRLADSGRFSAPIVTEISPLTSYYPAEDYHQDYYQKNPIRYKYYRYRSGRDEFLTQSWPEEK